MHVLADAPLLAVADLEDFLLQSSTVADVANDAGEQPPVAKLHFADGQIDRKVEPSFRCATTSRPMPMILALPVRR